MTLLKPCPDCDGYHFNVAEDGLLICTSRINDTLGCGWRGYLTDEQKAKSGETMEISVDARPRMTLDQFANEHNLKMVVTERGQEIPAAIRWYAQFDNSNIIDGCMLRSSCGDGPTKEEAIENYGPKISEKEIVIGAYSDDRREIQVPIIVSVD